MNLNDLPDMSSAYKQVQEKNDGNLANNAPPYDKVTKRDVITGRLGKDEMGGKRKKHDCAKKVNYKSEEWDCIPEQHTMLEDGTVTHYDITNGENIVENVPVEELEILISEKHEHFDNYDKNAEMLEGYGKKKKMKKEAFYFTDEEIADMVEIDEATDEELVDFFVEMIQELAEDEEDLLGICEALEEVELLDEASDKYYDSAVKSSKAAAKANRPSRVERMKSAAKAAGSKLKAGASAAGAAVKKGVKAVGKSAAANAGKAVGTFQANRIKAKRAELSKPSEKKKEASKSSDDDGTGGKLDALLAKTRGTSSSSSSSSGGGGERDAGSEARERLKSKKKGPGLLRRVAGAVGKGLKKAVGKTARAVSSGSGKLASRLGEDYDKIAHLYESGLFSIQEIESVIEEGYKEIDRSKENKMYRRAGNLARTGLASKGKKKEDALNKSNKIVSAISSQKERERFSKMADIKARDNYGG
jgi:hypothetical protein